MNDIFLYCASQVLYRKEKTVTFFIDWLFTQIYTGMIALDGLSWGTIQNNQITGKFSNIQASNSIEWGTLFIKMGTIANSSFGVLLRDRQPGQFQMMGLVTGLQPFVHSLDSIK